MMEDLFRGKDLKRFKVGTVNGHRRTRLERLVLAALMDRNRIIWDLGVFAGLFATGIFARTINMN